MVFLCARSVVSDSANLRTVTRKALLSMGFPRQEYWSGLSFPPPGDFPNPGIKPVSPVASALHADSLSLASRGKPREERTVAEAGSLQRNVQEIRQGESLN